MNAGRKIAAAIARTGTELLETAAKSLINKAANRAHRHVTQRKTDAQKKIKDWVSKKP